MRSLDLSGVLECAGVGRERPAVRRDVRDVGAVLRRRLLVDQVIMESNDRKDA
jgi:hypothetical protein